MTHSIAEERKEEFMLDLRVIFCPESQGTRIETAVQGFPRFLSVMDISVLDVHDVDRSRTEHFLIENVY